MSERDEQIIRGTGEIGYQIAPSERPSEAVVEAVATVSRADPIGPSDGDEDESASVLDPLYETIDPDALDSLFRPTAGGEPGDGQVTFEYAGCEVTVLSDGLVTVRSNG